MKFFIFKYSKSFTGFILLVLFLSALLIACQSNNTVQVKAKISLSKENKDISLKNVTMYADGDKYIIAYIKAGETITSSLWPKKNSNPQLTILYDFNSELKEWSGPEMPIGKGYKIEIFIDKNGDVVDSKVTS